MRIFFFADNSIPIHARSLEERPLGGTETGLIRVAESLHRRGHEVKVFTSMESPPPSPAESPYYLPASTLPLAGECDLFVAVQGCSGAFQSVQAERIVYWTGDGPEQFTTFGIGDKRFIDRVDLILAVSNWHRDALSRQSGFPGEKIAVIRNGIVPNFFSGDELRERQRLIFTAAPHRGLQLALRAFSLIKPVVPALELHIYSGFELYDREQPFSGPQKSSFDDLKRQCEELDGCFIHGNILQEELAKEYQRSGIFIYPATVPETSCITAIEAKAAGCPAVVSSLGALPETVGEGGLVVGGEPATHEFQENFAKAVMELLQNEALWKKCSEWAKRDAEENYSWEHVADRFLQSVGS